MQDNEGIYRDLQQHLDKMPIGFPATEDGSDIKVLKAFFTPQQAELATLLNFIPVSLKKIYSQIKKSGISLEETQEKLDAMVEKGLIFKEVNPKTNKISYGNLPYAIGFYENQVNRLTKGMAQASEDYGERFIREFLGEDTGIPQMRTVPINKAISHENVIMNYDNARKILENVEGPYAVAPCVCVQSKDLIGIKCKHDWLERCMVNSQDYLDKGNAREITKEEAFKILGRAEEEGLVIQPGNSKSTNGFCICCGCCCGILSHAKKLESPARLFASNFFAEIDKLQCTGCGTCADFCPMEAIILDDVSSINRERCIGCGVCVSKCPSKAIHLRNKEKSIVPPETYEDLMIKIATKKKKR
jgi:Pyruvate/2-oxoacid:ferredoxin oxidoreductase delta subunit